MIMHIIKCVPDQLGCKMYLISIPIIVHICLVFVSCSHSVDIFSHLESSEGNIGRHLLFSLMGWMKRESKQLWLVCAPKPSKSRCLILKIKQDQLCFIRIQVSVVKGRSLYSYSCVYLALLHTRNLINICCIELNWIGSGIRLYFIAENINGHFYKIIYWDYFFLYCEGS